MANAKITITLEPMEYARLKRYVTERGELLEARLGQLRGSGDPQQVRDIRVELENLRKLLTEI